MSDTATSSTNLIHLAAKPQRKLLQSEVAVSRMMTFIA